MKFSRAQAEEWWRIALVDAGIHESSAILFEFAERDDGYVGKAWLRSIEIDNHEDQQSLG